MNSHINVHAAAFRALVAHDASRGRCRSRGFTLVEAIMTITITAILAGIVAVFIRSPLEGYFDSVRRAELTDAADGALRRIARDVRTALPNSLRTAVSESNSCFEFLPTVGGGRYRESRKADGTGDPLDFSQADSAFDALSVSADLPPQGGYGARTFHAVVYNLGISGADAYNTADGNRAQIDGASTAANIKLSAPNQFPFRSPDKHFHVIEDYSVIYSCAGGQLRRTQINPIPTAKQADCPTGGTILADNVTFCEFVYAPAATVRYGLLSITLELSTGSSGEKIRLHEDVHVNNLP